MPVKYREINFPDPLNQAGQKNITLAVDELSKRADIFASPVQFLSGSGAINVNSSVAMWTGPAGGTISLPRSTAQGKNTAAVIIVGNLTINAVSVKAVAGETINGSTAAVSLAANSAGVFSSDGAGHWLISGPPAGVAIGVQTFTAGGTYTASPGVRSQVVELWGGGGGGTGAVTGSTGVNVAVGPGGGAGAYARRRYAIAGGATGTVVIGAGGTAGANTGAIAGAGGASTFTDGTTLLTAPGGTAGPASAAAASTPLITLGAAPSAVATNGNVNGRGDEGGYSLRISSIQSVSGRGGATSLGGAGQEIVTTGAGNSAAANSGSGGGGGQSLTTASPQVGGAGGTGFCVITEYA
jgi:hypothetical protein